MEVYGFVIIIITQGSFFFFIFILYSQCLPKYLTKNVKPKNELYIFYVLFLLILITKTNYNK